MSRFALPRLQLAALLLGVGFLTLIGLGSTILFQVTAAREFSAGTLRAQELRVATAQVRALIQGAETGQRGYLLTGEPRYLEPYREASSTLEAALDRLERVTRAEGDAAELIAPLRAVAGIKMAELRETVERFERGDTDGALWIVRTDEGRIAMLAIDAIGAAIDRRAAARVAARDRAQARASTRLVWGGAGALALILAVAAGTGLLARATARELQASAAEVRAANEGLEERVRERTADLEAANAEIQRFAYIVSHDLRAPLVNVMGFTSEIETALGPVREQLAALPEETVLPAARTAIEGDVPEAIGFIRSSTERMDRLIKAILQLSREGQRKLSPERVDTGTLVHGLIASVQHQAAAIGASVEIEGNLPTLTADRLGLEQVFGNLLDNAIKYLDSGRPGRVVVRGRQIPSRRSTAQAVFEVEDNGRGIDPRDGERIFDLFRRAGRQDRPGEGIGLAHVRALVRRMGGSIGYESALGRGTLFRVTLPVTAAIERRA